MSSGAGAFGRAYFGSGQQLSREHFLLDMNPCHVADTTGVMVMATVRAKPRIHWIGDKDPTPEKDTVTVKSKIIHPKQLTHSLTRTVVCIGLSSDAKAVTFPSVESLCMLMTL